MTKRSQATETHRRRTTEPAANADDMLDIKYGPTTHLKPAPLEPKTEAQKRYLNAIRHFTCTFGIGPAGTGKTYIAVSLAAQMLESKQIDRLIMTRPAVEAGESMGFLPGELDEKYEPYLTPLREVLQERLGARTVEYLLKSGRIEAVPLAYMRGRTFKNAFVLLDEAQNVTPKQMKMFLTRIGEGCKVVVDGDIGQSDLGSELSGLADAVARLRHIPALKVVTFSRDDIVRSGFVAEVSQGYECPIPELGLPAI